MVKRKDKVCEGVYKRHTLWMLILGILILGNALWVTVTWPVFIGAFLVLVGLAKLVWPCNCC